MNKNLLEKSDIYYKKADIYDIFAAAEDKPNHIFEALKNIIIGKEIVDMGCGTGKYPQMFAPLAKSVFAFDAAEDQIKIARDKLKGYLNVSVNYGDAAEIKIEEKKYDIIFSSWMLSTITDIKKRESVLENMKKALKPDGKIILVENDFGGEFEDIRGRVHDPLERTKKYNDWLLDKGFSVYKAIDTYFEFKDIDEARAVINEIWGDTASQKIRKKVINHKVVLFKLDN